MQSNNGKKKEKKYITAADLSKEAVINEAELATVVYLDGNDIVININFEYRIEKQRCNTAEKILTWVHHLLGKKLMSEEIMYYFIAIATKEAGVDLNLPKIIS